MQSLIVTVWNNLNVFCVAPSNVKINSFESLHMEVCSPVKDTNTTCNFSRRAFFPVTHLNGFFFQRPVLALGVFLKLKLWLTYCLLRELLFFTSLCSGLPVL